MSSGNGNQDDFSNAGKPSRKSWVHVSDVLMFRFADIWRQLDLTEIRTRHVVSQDGENRYVPASIPEAQAIIRRAICPQGFEKIMDRKAASLSDFVTTKNSMTTPFGVLFTSERAQNENYRKMKAEMMTYADKAVLEVLMRQTTILNDLNDDVIYMHPGFCEATPEGYAELYEFLYEELSLCRMQGKEWVPLCEDPTVSRTFRRLVDEDYGSTSSRPSGRDYDVH